MKREDGATMNRYYISIEKNIEVFELYKALWKAQGIHGIRVDSMTEGIEKAIEIERSATDELFFIDIVADDVDYLPQLKILSEETNAPILVVTFNYNEEEHYQALNSGADSYGGYCEQPDDNINAVFASIESIKRRTNRHKAPDNVLACGDILIAADVHKAFIKDKELVLSSTEMRIMQYLMINRGNIMSHGMIIEQIFDDNDEKTTDSLYSAIKRLRMKIRAITPFDYIQTIREVGYRLVPKSL